MLSFQYQQTNSKMPESSDTFLIKQVNSSCGLLVDNIDLANPSVVDQLDLKKILSENKFLVFKNQSINEHCFFKLAKAFGSPKLHIVKKFRHPLVPEILILSNQLVDNKRVGINDGSAYWHTDNSYEHTPASATLLLCRSAALNGGQTLIADMVSAYKDLPNETKAYLETLEVVHRFCNRDSKEGRKAAPKLADSSRSLESEVIHPLIIKHPITGEKALYGIAGSSVRIKGLKQAESLSLLRNLTEHATSDKYVYKHSYEKNDLLIFDTLSTLHSGTLLSDSSKPENIRTLFRISVY